MSSISEWVDSLAYKVKAYETGKVTIWQALEFNHTAQIRALEAGATIEQALKIGKFQYWALEHGATVEQALKFENYHHYWAVQHGATFEQASRFENDFQDDALEAGVTPEKALEFKNAEQVAALIAGATAEQALMFEKYNQIMAFKTGLVTAEEASRFENNDQVTALRGMAFRKEEINVEKALLGSRGETVTVEPMHKDSGLFWANVNAAIGVTDISADEPSLLREPTEAESAQVHAEFRTLKAEHPEADLTNNEIIGANNPVEVMGDLAEAPVA